MAEVQAGSMCALCGQQPSVIFCLCASSPVCVCQACITVHSQSPGNHDISPIDDFPYATAISIDVYKKKRLAIAQGAAFVEAVEQQEELNYQMVKKRVENYVEVANFFIDSLHNTLKTTIGQLKASLQAALHTPQCPEILEFVLTHGQRMQEARMDLYDVSVLESIETASNMLSATLTEFKAKDFADYLLSHMKAGYLGKSAPRKTTAAPNALSEVYLPVIYRNILRKYYSGEGGSLGMIEFPFCPRVDQCSSYALMANGDVFCCGGQLAGKHAYYIGTLSPKMTILPNMHHGRARPGVITFNNLPYVFGGSNSKVGILSCERFLMNDSWELIPRPMRKARSGFTPVIWNSLIYLPGGTGSNTVEVFDPVKVEFRTLDLILPKAGKSLSFLYDGQLYILIGSDMFLMNLQDEKLKNANLQTEIKTWSPISPIVSDRKVLFWGFAKTSLFDSLRMKFGGAKHGICYSFDLPSNRLVELERFEYSIPQ